MTVRVVALFWLGALFGLTGCGATIGLYHSAEGGAIAQDRQPPPGAAAPYPNLASVPAAPVALSPAMQAAVDARLAGQAGNGGVSAPSPQALAGLALPGVAPPLPDVPDLVIPQSPAVALAPPPVVVAAPVAVPPPSAPVALSFPAGSALLDPRAAEALQGIAAASGGARVLVVGFGESDRVADGRALALGLARAERLADALTADGVAPGAIRMMAAAAGSGGFVQLFY